MVAALSLLAKDLITSGLSELADAIFDKGEDFVKEKVKDVTGIELKDRVTPEQAAQIKSKYEELLPMLQEKNRHEEKLLEYQQELEEEYTKRRETASNQYVQTDHKMADEIAKKIIDWNIIFIMVCIGIELWAIIELQDNGNMLAVITGIFGSVTTYLYQERQAVINFHFGSSLGSKMKDSAILNKGK